MIFLKLYTIVIGLIGLFALHRFSLLGRYFAHRNKSPKPGAVLKVIPSITIQLPVYNEPAVVARLLEAVSKLAWPTDKLQVQILDDSTDATCDIIDKFILENPNFKAEVIRRSSRTGFKAGALKKGLETSTGEYVVVFDSDFIPQTDFLHSVVRHFEDDSIDMVQVRWEHANRRFNWLTRAQALLLDGHFILEHTARNRSGCFFNFNGTAGVWRKSAILKAGNWEGDTLTEDLDLSYRAQIGGSKFLYLPDYGVPAELPNKAEAFKSQQHRWTKGTAQVLRKLSLPLLRSKAPLRVKFEGMAHFLSGICYPLVLLLGLLLWPVAEYRHSLGEALGQSLSESSFLITSPSFWAAGFDLMFVPAGLVSFFSYYWVAGRESKALSLIETPIEVVVGLFLGIGICLSNSLAFFEGLFFSGGVFERTPKEGSEEISLDSNSGSNSSSKKKPRVSGWRPWLVYLEAALVLYFAGAIVRLLSIGEFGSVPFILVFLVSNLWMLISGMNLDLSGVSPKRILGKQNPIFDLPKSPVLGEALRQGSETKVPNPKVVPGAIGSLKAEVLPPTSADSISRAPVTPPVAGPVAETGLTGDSNNRGQFKQAPRSI